MQVMKNAIEKGREVFAIVVPTLMYESKTWVLNKKQESAIQATEMSMLRRI